MAFRDGAWLDRLTAPFAPQWTLRRQRARMAAELVARHYEAGSGGRRTQGWRRPSSDANAALAPGLVQLRNTARDLVRNNPYAESAVSTICDHVVGWGIVAKPPKGRLGDAWKAWAETPACDADGRLDLYGLEKQVLRTVVEGGEALVRRRWRRPADKLPLPVQLQVLEPDFLDHTREGRPPTGTGVIVQGVQFGPFGQREGYWLYPEHPGASGISSRTGSASQFVPASEILHVYKASRPGAVRAASWFAPVLLRLKDFDDYEDAALMKQKIAACLAVIVTDVDGTAPAVLSADDTRTPAVDSLEPGVIMSWPAGKTATVVQPPTISEHDAYAKSVLRAIATGLGVAYEDLVGDYTNVPYSAARMSRIRAWARVEDWRWRMLIPQFCDPVWRWAMEAAAVEGLTSVEAAPRAYWTAPPPPMLDPDVEGRAYTAAIRAGRISWSEAAREQGYDPDDLLAEIKADFGKLKAAGLILDSDPSQTTQAGNPRETAATQAAEPRSPRPTDDRAAVRVAQLQDDLTAVRAELLAERAAARNGHAPDVHVNVPAQAAPTVNVDARTHIAEGALQVAPPTVNVDARTTIAEGAVAVDVSQAPPQPITVLRLPKAPEVPADAEPAP